MSDRGPGFEAASDGSEASTATVGAAQPIAPAPPSMGAAARASGAGSPRPLPVYGSLLGTAAGLLLLASLFLLLGELGAGQRRIGGILLSLAFEAVGVLLLVTNRNQRTATSGVVVTAIGIIPLLVYLFVDVKDPGRTINSVGSFTRTATLVLLVAALLWLAAFLFGPGRRYGFYLGAALLALWLVSVVQIVDRPLGQLATGFGSFTTSSTFTPVGPGGSSFDSSDFNSSDRFDSSDFDSGDAGPRFPSNDVPTPENPATKLGIASLLFGGAYLALGRQRDQAGDGRTATAFFAVSIPILTLAVLFLGSPLETAGTSLLAIALSAVAIAIAAPRGRRFTSWYATAAAVFAVFALVDDVFGDSNRAMAATLALAGVGLALLASRLPGGSDDIAMPIDPTAAPPTPFGSSTPSPYEPPTQAGPPGSSGSFSPNGFSSGAPTSGAGTWPAAPPSGSNGWEPPVDPDPPS